MKKSHNERFLGVTIIGLVVIIAAGTAVYGSDYYSPVDVAADSTGDYIYVAEHTANQIDEVAVATSSVNRTLELPQAPTGLAISDDDTELYVTAGSSDGKVYVISITGWSITHTIDVGHTPMSPVVNSEGTALYVCNRFDNTVSVVSLSTYSQTNTVSVVREPVAMVITGDDSYLFVANFLPAGSLDPGNTAAVVSVINTSTENKITDITLLNGSVALRDICISSDGNHAYVTHQLSRYQMPMMQADRGWLMTGAVSIIDTSSRQLVNTFVLDEIYNAAGTPADCACTTTGSDRLCVTHAGTHEISVIDIAGVHSRLANLPYEGGFSDNADDVPNDLGFLADLRERIALQGNGPRAIALIGREAYVAEYFSDSISVVNIDTGELEQILLGPQNPPDLQRKGERLFNDNSISYQNWLSCASCHPGARPDTLNWDFGPGSPRNTRSHLHCPNTPPTNIEGNCPTAYDEIYGGFVGDLFVHNPDASPDSDAILEFMSSLEPVTSPYLVNGQLSADAQQGKTIFENRCVSCHSGEYYTDMSSHNVGTGYGSGESFDTPTLCEVWRTAPYLQDGRAATMQEVLTTYNTGHFDDSALSPTDLANLAEYVLSLPEPAVPCYPGDFDADCDVDEDDLERLIKTWLCQTHDVNWDEACDIAEPSGIIDLNDYSQLAQDWYKGK